MPHGPCQSRGLPPDRLCSVSSQGTLSVVPPQLRSLSTLSACPSLVALDVSENGLGGSLLASQLERLPSLTHLNLQANAVSRPDDAAAIASALPALRVLCLRDSDGGRACPVCSHPAYLPAVLEAAPGLVVLDGETMALHREARALLGDAAAGAGAAEDVKLPPAYGERWGRGVAPRAVGSRAAASDAEALLEVRSTSSAMQDLRDAVSKLSEADRRGARAVEPVIRQARAAKS